MDERDKQRIIERYNQRLALYGDDIRTLASGTEERRHIRFGVLCGIGLEEGKSVLDLGCGFGDLYDYLQEQGMRVDYTGYDINPELIAIAQRKYPGARFELKDVQTEPFPEFDFIVSTSAFNLRLGSVDNYQFIEDIFRTCYAHARIGVAIDFLSSYVDYQTQGALHYSPERLFGIAKRITKRVCVRHDYPLFEFCIYLYKDFPGRCTL